MVTARVRWVFRRARARSRSPAPPPGRSAWGPVRDRAPADGRQNANRGADRRWTGSGSALDRKQAEG
ncbi:hypothetical protein SCWH03_21110 [Streptomyces pacificus]|uniref:Uncharacterized protein n=1 Tax=Streptomyces pacificus TaxID=2705029 RepID=A0A6A0ASF7_9ACTN|nr:hypothetical protein SCWH03_21110 [Streptomyces pacificus]